MSNVAFNPAGTIILSSGVAVVGHGRAFSRKRRRFVDNSTTAAASVITGGTEEEEDPAIQLTYARDIFVTNLTKQYLKFAVRPAADDEGKIWEDSIAVLIEGFFGIARLGTKFHAWIMDPAGDAEPALQAGEGVWANLSILRSTSRCQMPSSRLPDESAFRRSTGMHRLSR